MTLVKRVDLFGGLLCPGLHGDKLAGSFGEALLVRRIDHILVPSVAGALLSLLTPILASAELRTLRLTEVFLNDGIVNEVSVYILTPQIKVKM